jgi:hypothetical protein
MLSGHAESIYWLGRYVERAEDGARLANVHANLLLDLPRKYTFGWAPLIAITGYSDLFAEHYKEASERNVAPSFPRSPARARTHGCCATCCRGRPGSRSTNCTCAPGRTPATRSPRAGAMTTSKR